MQVKKEGQGYPVNNEVDHDKQVKAAVDWKNPPTLKELKEDFQSAREQTENQLKKIEEWLDAFNATGKFKAPDVEGRSKASVRLVRKQVEWRCPSLTEPFLSSNKIFNVAPRTYEDKQAAVQNELILNYQFKTKVNAVKLMDDIVRTMATEGTVVLHPMWKYKEDVFKEVENIFEPTPTVDEDYQAQIMQIAQEVQNNPDVLQEFEENIQLAIQKYLEEGVVLEYRFVETKVNEVKKVRSNHPIAEVVPTEDVFADPSCKGDIEKAKFVVKRFDTCLASLREDGRYINLDELEQEVISNEQSTAKPNDSGFKFKDKARKSLEAYEYWGYYDIDGTGILYSFVCTWVGNTLIRLERNPHPDNKLPFIFIPLIPVKHSLYGEPDAELIKDNQLIMSATMRGAIDLFGKSANGQTGLAKGFLDQTNLGRFNRGENYTYNSTMRPEAAIHTHKFNEIPQSVFLMMNYLTNEAEAFSGVKSFNQGISGDSLGKTAKAGRTALDASAIRDASILRRIAEGMVQMAYKFQAMNAELLTEDDVVRLTNKEYVRVDPENLNGDFDLTIDISTPESDQAKADDLVMMMQTGQGIFPLPFVQKIFSEIARLKNMPDLQQFVEEYQPEPDPFQEQMQQLELQQKQAEIEEIRARSAEMLAKAQVNLAEINVRAARAENTISQTDKNNIQTYKEANGISQEEKLQLEETKARIKQQQDMVQHNLNKDIEKQKHNQSILQEGAKNDLAGLSESGNSSGST